ncbi:hypothetical protein ASD11_11795 [Aeromicrobium sp. Root495]|nr:hypothetical protein ASD11_11795 [Aeromicrobium sp. Root495]
MLLAVLTATQLVPPGQAASAASCTGRPVLLVHDFAGTSATLAPVADALRADRRCPVLVDHGAGGLLALVGLGGLASLDQSAPQVGLAIDRTAQGRKGRSVDVVAYGAGSLATLRTLQASALRRARVHSFVAIGGLWDGTNLAGLGGLDRLSRDVGSYDTVLAVEKLVLDPVCAVCRELISHSDFLNALRARGLRTPGIRRVDVVSTDDVLVQPFSSGVAPGSRAIVVTGVNHLLLPRSAAVTRAVRSALTP